MKALVQTRCGDVFHLDLPETAAVADAKAALYM